MASEIKVKLILELRAALMSQREISRRRKISQHSVATSAGLPTSSMSLHRETA